MLAFVEGRADVLVATTIIENGLDIPRANTIIINRADRYGLAQLYQLRGRVGRSDRRAYAYLLVPPDTVLSEIARKRLAAIREFSELGAGFRIAALDLELRGAGNLLGGEQSGHIEAVGLDLYVKLLEQTILELKGEPAREEAARGAEPARGPAHPGRTTCPRCTSACRSTSASARSRRRGRARGACAARSATATARRPPRWRTSCVYAGAARCARRRWASPRWTAPRARSHVRFCAATPRPRPRWCGLVRGLSAGATLAAAGDPARARRPGPRPPPGGPDLRGRWSGAGAGGRDRGPGL